VPAKLERELVALVLWGAMGTTGPLGAGASISGGGASRPIAPEMPAFAGLRASYRSIRSRSPIRTRAGFRSSALQFGLQSVSPFAVLGFKAVLLFGTCSLAIGFGGIILCNNAFRSKRP